MNSPTCRRIPKYELHVPSNLSEISSQRLIRSTSFPLTSSRENSILCGRRSLPVIARGNRRRPNTTIDSRCPGCARADFHKGIGMVGRERKQVLQGANVFLKEHLIRTRLIAGNLDHNAFAEGAFAATKVSARLDVQEQLAAWYLALNGCGMLELGSQFVQPAEGTLHQSGEGTGPVRQAAHVESKLGELEVGVRMEMSAKEEPLRSEGLPANTTTVELRRLDEALPERHGIPGTLEDPAMDDRDCLVRRSWSSWFSQGAEHREPDTRLVRET